jgi:PAS domain S-box-containing protein
MEIEKPDWLAQMEGVLEVLNEGVMILDDCARFIYGNQRLLDLLGITTADFLGRTPDHFYQGEDLQFLLRQREFGLRQGHNRVEFFLPLPDGRRIPVIISARTLEDLEGREFSILTVTDISEQKRIEQELREANALLEQRQREIELELSLAERVQQSLAPQSLRWGPVVVETAYQPVRTIGGDFGMVVPHGEEELTLLVCDVSGHGISSALVANRIYSEIISLLERRTPLADMLHRLNRFVLDHIRTSGFYFTMAAARLARGGRRLSYAGAGHPPALLLRRAGPTRHLMPQSAVLGLLEDGVGAQPVEEFELAAGDRLVLYTDGITDNFNERDEMFGTTGLEQALASSDARPLCTVKQGVMDRISAWRHGPPGDDMSLVLLEVQ